MTTKHKLLAGLALLGSLLVCAPPATAQEPGRITGQVTDAQSGQPLGEVQVYIPGSGIGTLTRSNGRFIILNVQPGTHEPPPHPDVRAPLCHAGRGPRPLTRHGRREGARILAWPGEGRRSQDERQHAARRPRAGSGRPARS